MEAKSREQQGQDEWLGLVVTREPLKTYIGRKDPPEPREVALQLPM